MLQIHHEISTWLNLALRLLSCTMNRISHMGYSINRYSSLVMNIFSKIKNYIDFWISLKWWENFVRPQSTSSEIYIYYLKKTIWVTLKWHYLTSVVSQYKTYISVLKLTIDSNHRFLDFWLKNKKIEFSDVRPQRNKIAHIFVIFNHILELNASFETAN